MELWDNRVINFKYLSDHFNFLPKDENEREINIYKAWDVVNVSESLLYPNILFYSYRDKTVFTPYIEKTMSLQKCTSNIKIIEEPKYTSINNNIFFFFIYNTDNYFHFIYDTVPYLISFLYLKQKYPNIKLLMGPPLHGKEHYKFVTEFLELLNINDVEFLQKNVLYKNIYISNSYTHDGLSEYPPRKEIYSFLEDISKKIDIKKDEFPSNIYISRRTWIHNDTSNIGTNYTTRRKLTNEDDLVKLLISYNYKEIFTETLTTKEKLALFQKAKNIIGAIGGGMCNVLFCKPNTNVITIVSPTFLEVNNRFKYSFSNVNISYFTDTKHVERGSWKKYMRVYHAKSNIIGEIIDVKKNKIYIQYTNKSVTGWNNDMNLNVKGLLKKECEKLDNGLNSNWSLNIKKFQKIL